MNNKFFYLSVLATMALTANACDTGDYNDLDCDESYVSDCIAENAYMKCDLETKKLIVVQCASTGLDTDKEMSCHQGASGARCVSEDMIANKCEADVCASDALLHKCVDGIIEPVICSGATPKCGIDATGKAACVSEGSQSGESCTKTVCDTATNVIKVCVDGKVTETKRCSEDGSSICGTQGEGEAAVQACIPNPEYCDVDACGEDGKIKRCSDHRYLAAATCDDTDESLKCFDVTKGEGADAKTVGECRKSCTADVCSDDGKIQKCVVENDATSGYLAEAADCAVAGEKCFSVTTVTGETTTTQDVCKATCTEDECVSSTTLNKCHKANGAQEGYVEVETCDTAETGKAGVCMGNACVNINNQQFIGAPCECTGTDCDVVYNKDEIESFFSEAGQTWLGTVDDASKLKEGDEIRGANFFAKSTCNDLATKLNIAERDDIIIGCFRDTVVKLPTSFATLFSTEFAKRIKAQICPNGDTDDKCVVKEGETKSVFDVIAESLVAVGAVLGDGINFTAPQGYCTMGALKMDGMLAEGTAKGTAIDIFSENAFLATPAAGQVSLFSRFNGGVIPSTEAGAASVCPEGSELYKYEIGKNFSDSFGKATIHYALCLQKCTDGSTCREGYQCMKLTENSYKGEKANKAERSNVCFPMKNHTYMEKTLKPAFNNFMLSLFK